MSNNRFVEIRRARRKRRALDRKNRESGFGVQRYIREQKAMSGDKWRPEWVAN